MAESGRVVIVTTERGRYQVDELASGRFLLRRLDAPTAPEAIEVTALQLEVGLSFMFALSPCARVGMWTDTDDGVSRLESLAKMREWRQVPDHPRNRITAIEP